MIEKIKNQVGAVVGSFQKLQSFFDGGLAASDLKNLFKAFNRNATDFDASLKNGNLDNALKCAKMISLYGQQIAAKTEDIPDDRVRNAARLLEIDSDLLVESINYGSTSVEHDMHDERIKKLLNQNELRITELEKRIQDLEGEAQNEINKVLAAYSEGLEVINSSKSEINEILGHVSGRAIAGDYEKSAADERAMADWLRYGALACMGLIVLVLGSAVAATITNEFEWPRFLSRVSLVFLLSVPAAYLARESAKHREQQYQHQQTSLDMKAVSPFLASLPEDERHKIKAAIASRIFSGKDFSKVSSDPYPINTHEILMELIKKLEVTTKATPSDKSTPV